ncbi:hypothetical protein AOQ84DRAFT_220794 [Glonium stellatum]|uniref:Heterokaryon incompatibility domain-containing protein n=1 Tax=Glonium stellatum TaxID=574774 RepID=A0A8E2F2T1_9PEZI|nr:hypothetical protein AOQ84DRAFT_220794 [Glonium stellatum]
MTKLFLLRQTWPGYLHQPTLKDLQKSSQSCDLCHLIYHNIVPIPGPIFASRFEALRERGSGAASAVAFASERGGARSPTHRNEDPLRQEPLMSRAWTLRERYLSHRILHFGTDQMFWECDSGLFSESGNWTARYTGLNDALDVVLDEAGTFWYLLLETYSVRKITYGRDKFPALSGLVDEFRRRFNDQYVAGLWWKDMCVGLAWVARGFLKQPSEWRAPSWSWAHQDGPVKFNGSYRVGDSLVVWNDFHIRTASEDPCGEVLKGSITLQAPSCPIWFLDPSNKHSFGQENEACATIKFAQRGF